MSQVFKETTNSNTNRGEKTHVPKEFSNIEVSLEQMYNRKIDSHTGRPM